MYRVLNNIIDLISGFEINSELEKIMERDFWNRDKIELDQKTKFDRLSNIASKSDFYKKYKGNDLAEYPIMERNEFKMNLENIKTNVRSSYAIQHTSGSTSYPVTLLISKEMLLAKRVAHQKMLRWFGLNRESPEFKVGGIKENYKSKLYYYLRNKKYINSFRIKENNIESIINKYNQFKPSILYGYPSAIYNLIQFTENKSFSLHNPVIIVSHAENLYPVYIDKFNKIFPDSTVVNQYWATEANIAVTCPHGRLHLDEDTVICELINKNKDGVGDLLITNLYSYDLPIIRYKIGDRVKLSYNRCTCGRASRVIEYIEGREIDYLELPDQRKIPVTAIYLSKYADNIISYQLIYYKSQKLIEFRYVPYPKNVSINCQLISDEIKRNYGLSTKFVRVDEIQYSSSGKFKKLVVVC